ncbi:unnamed protein product [Trichobilharzia regenti]|nr:unnamed protein product [Trichobilharzia regenti]
MTSHFRRPADLNEALLMISHIKPVNQLAERVLLSIRSKLQGFVSENLVTNSNETSINCGGGSGIAGGLDQLDVAAHVDSLVRPAIDH